MSETSESTRLVPENSAAKVRTSFVRRTQPNGWRHVYEVQSVYDKTTRNTRVLKSRLVGKLPPGEADLEKMVPTNKRYSPMRCVDTTVISNTTTKALEDVRTDKMTKKRNAALINSILARTSLGPKHQEMPGPDEETLTLAGRAAMRAPAHEKKFPVRLVEIASRDRLADLYRARLPEDASEEDLKKADEKAGKGACLLALVVRKPEEGASERDILERGAAAGAALMNVLTVLQARGYAAKTVSACDFTDPDGLYDPQAEMLLAFILCGTPKRALAKNPDSDIFKGRNKRGVLTTW